MEVWQMTDEQLGEELLKAYDAIGKDGESTVNVWFAQKAREEAIHRLMNYAARLNLKVLSVAHKPLGR